MPEIQWVSVQTVPARAYACGHCGIRVASDRGWQGVGAGSRFPNEFILVCPQCHQPSYFSHRVQVPGAAYGEVVQNLPDEVGPLYMEARVVMGVGAYTAAVMVSRKILANVAVTLGADPGLTFAGYIAWLEGSGHIPPRSRGWVERIREKGNEANHEIAAISKEDAEQMITFLAMLLKIVFEFPAQLS